MNQSSYIAAFLLAGFVLFLAANNRLSEYAAILWGSPAPPPGEKGAVGSTRGGPTAPTSSQPFIIGGGLVTSPNTTVVNLDPVINSAIGTVLGTVAGWFGL